MLMVFTFLHNKLIISPPLPVSELASKHSAPSLSIPASKRSILEKAHKTFPIATAHYKKKVSALRTLLVMLFPRYFTMPASRKLLNQTCFHNSINNKLFLLVSTAWNQTFHQYWNLFLSLIPDVVILSFSELVMVLVSQGLIPLLTNGFQNCIQINHRFYIIKIRCLFLYIKIE